MKKVLSILSLFGTLALTAGVLNVDLDVCTSVDERDAIANKYKEVVIFLLDQSYSMTSKAVEVDRPDDTRDEVLREMLDVRLNTIAEKKPNSQIYVVTFSGDMCGPFGPYTAKDRKEILSKLNCTKGGTLLYDTLAHAIEFGEGLLQKDPMTKIRMFVYSDGKNELYSDYWTRKRTGEVKWYESQTERVPVVYRDDNASEAFKRDYLGRIKEHALNGRMSLETGCWLGPGNPPALIENKRKDDYKLELSSDGKELKNPSSNPSQNMAARLVLPIPPQYEKDLANLKATVECEVDGKKVTGMVSLRPGRHTVRLNLPGNLPKSAFKGQMKVTNLPDAWDRISLSAPDPIAMDFAAPGALSFVSIEPREDIYVKVGDKVQFSAKASDGAAVSWNIQGEKINQETFSKAFDRAGTYAVTIVSEKEDFLPAKAAFKVFVIDATVSVDISPAKPKVGEKSSFKANVNGSAESYSWWVDDQAMTVKTASLGGQIFDRSGTHSVKARAIFGHGIVGEAERKFEVAAKPNIAIESPYNGQGFEFGEEIKAFAKVEGDYEKVVWELKGPDAKVETAVVDREARASKPVAFKPAKGGDYVLTATAEGKDAKLTSAPVKFSVKREDVMVRIDNPISGASVEVGSDLGLKAAVKGESIKEVKWTVTCAGKELFKATKPVQGGVSACVFKPADKLGNGSVLMIKAEAANDPGVESTVDVETRFFAELKIVSAKVGNRDANGLQANFGDQVAMEAACKGGVDATKVEWVAEIAGKESVIGNGLKVNAPKVSAGDIRGDGSLVTAKYYARAKLPDGSTITSGKVTVFFACDDIIANIVLPKGADGLERRSFKPGEPIHLQLSADGGRLTDVEWDFGDGKKAKGDNVEHAYADEKSHTISAKGKCAKCGKVFSTSVVISTACPDLELAIVLPKGDDGVTRTQFGLKKPVNVELSVKEGDAKDITWNFGDGSTAKGAAASHAYEKYGKYTISASAKCKRCGKSYTASPTEVEVTVLPAKAKFEIQEKGSYYTVASKLHLVSTSDGDVEDLIWTVDGQELTEYRGKAEAVVRTAGKPCEMNISLQAIGPAGTELSSASRDIRVRYGWWAILIILALAIVIICIAAPFLTNNIPAGWHIYMRVETRPGSAAEWEDLKRKFKYPHRAGIIRYFWSLAPGGGGKIAEIKVKDKKVSSFPGVRTFPCSAAAAVKISIKNGKPYFRGKGISADSIGLVCGDKYAAMYKQDIPGGEDPKYLFVSVDPSKSIYRYKLLLLLIILAVIAISAWAMLCFAV